MKIQEVCGLKIDYADMARRVIDAMSVMPGAIDRWRQDKKIGEDEAVPIFGCVAVVLAERLGINPFAAMEDGVMVENIPSDGGVRSLFRFGDLCVEVCREAEEAIISALTA